jgi:hypothetical protein
MCGGVCIVGEGSQDVQQTVSDSDRSVYSIIKAGYSGGLVFQPLRGIGF